MELNFLNEIGKHEVAQTSKIDQNSSFCASYFSRYY
jgi:hypothetical protein